MKRIGIVTGTRAEYGLLKPIMRKIQEDFELELCIIATGMHLEKCFGMTYREIENDGFQIDYKNNMDLISDSSYAVCKSMGIEMVGFAEILEDAKLDLMILLGDRFEIQIAAIAGMIYRIPIAHIHGGELTQGLIDDAIRHSVTKMSALHFASTEEYRKRIIQMGELPERVYCVGAVGVENIKSLTLLNREELVEKFGEIFLKPYVMVTYHPVTLENHSSKWQFENLLEVISLHKEYNYVFTYANADPDGQVINELIQKYVENNTNTIAFVSMGQLGYLSALKYCKFVVGNSSSGIIEAPSFGIPTIDIGERQAGRTRAASVIDCGYLVEDIEKAIKIASSDEFTEKAKCCKNPYEREGTSEIIVGVIKRFLNSNTGIKKKFFDIEVKE